MYRPCVAGPVLCIVEVAGRARRYTGDTIGPNPAIHTAHQGGRRDTATTWDTGMILPSTDRMPRLPSNHETGD